MHGNSNFERTTRNARNDRPPRGNEATERKQEAKRGKQWTRENKRDQWTTFSMTDIHA